MKAKLAALDLEVMGSRPDEAGRQMRLDFDKWGQVSQRINLQLD
jgi:hypothetical protein